MGEGMRIDFGDKNAARLRFDQKVVGFPAVVQNAMVNIATSKGSDKVWPEKGTDLMRAAVRGAIVHSNSARHASNFAALDTLFFSRETDDPVEGDALAEVILQPEEISEGRLKINAKFTSTSAQIIGNEAII